MGWWFWSQNSWKTAGPSKNANNFAEKRKPLTLSDPQRSLNNYCKAQSCSQGKKTWSPCISWRTKAKMSSYEQITPVWPSNIQTYCDEYTPSVLHPSDTKLQSADYNSTALDKAAITTLDLIWAHVKVKKNANKASVCGKCHLTHCHWTISCYPSLVSSLWDIDRVQCNRQVRALCDKLGHLKWLGKLFIQFHPQQWIPSTRGT